MNKKKIFVACDSINISRIKEIINKTQNSKLTVGYKFGLEFINSKKVIQSQPNRVTFLFLRPLFCQIVVSRRYNQVNLIYY